MKNHKSILNKGIALWVLTVLLAFNLKACNNNQVDYPEGSIIMTTTAKELRIVLSGSDDIQIHWGDGKKSNLNEGILLNFDEGLEFSHKYSSAAKRTIYITGKVETLHCNNMQLTFLDISQNPELTALNCSDNQLTILDVMRNTALTTLICSNNKLTNLDVNKNTALEELNVGGNQITTIDVSRNTALKYLTCSNSPITSIDVSANTVLTILNLGRCQLTKLDLSNNTMLNSLCLRRNQLTASELNDLFISLFNVPQGQYAFIDYTENPGSHDADNSIWQEKNWLFQSCR